MVPFSQEQLERYMSKCIETALAVPASQKPYLPYVGALLVSSDGKVISAGARHLLAGTKVTIHAERDAIDRANLDCLDYPSGLVLITTLEPCLAKPNKNGGRNVILDSCADLISKSKIRTVVLGAYDSSDFVHSRRGEDYLRQHGAEVVYVDTLIERIMKELMPKSAMDAFRKDRHNYYYPQRH